MDAATLGDVNPGAERLAAQVARALEAEVLADGWPVGTSLGSETELRERFGVSRAVFREAGRLLEHHQVARMRRGPSGGLIICAPDAGPATRALVIYLEHVGTSIEDLMSVRLLLEPLAAGLASERMTEEGVALLRRTLAAEEHTVEPGIWAHEPLHLLLAELSGNPALALFIDVLTRLSNRYAHSVRRMPAAEVREAAESSRRRHTELADAVIAGNVPFAHTRMTDYLMAVAAWLQEHGARPAANQPRGRSVELRAPLAEQTAARIHDEVATAGWPIGAVVGTETDLLARYGVGREVLREAVRVLEHHGVVRARRGRGGGLVVTRPDPEASLDAMALFLEYRRVAPADLWVVRNALEVGVVGRVTERRSDPEVAHRLAAESGTDPADGVASASGCHSWLAGLSGNPVLPQFLHVVSEPSRRSADLPTAATTPGPEPLTAPSGRDARDAHNRIFAAIAAGDAALARLRMRRHLDDLRRDAVP